MKIKLFFLIPALILNLICQAAAPSLILPAPGRAGMFVAFNYVLAGLYKYDRGEIGALRVDFGNDGVYYDPLVGPNWWNYFFEPIELGEIDMNNLIHYTGQQINDLPIFALKTLSRKDANALIHKYIKIKPQINRKIAEFYRNEFKGNHVIGVHYRGTDKYVEIPRTAYFRVFEVVDKAVKEAVAKRKKFKIFVATDEQGFIDYMKQKFGPAAIIYIDAIRSVDRTPVHFRDTDQYKVGEEAIIDCLLLSKSDVLVRTPSSLSAASDSLTRLLK